VRRLPLLVWTVLCLPWLSASALAADAQAAAARVDRGLLALTAVRADFVQEITVKEGAQPERAVGTLWLRKPGRFRWEYSSPQQLIVCDGERLWLYDADLAQVTVRKIQQSLSQTPAMLLAGQAHVTEGFRVSEGGQLDGLVWSVLTPKNNDTDFKEIRMGFSGDSLTRLEFVDKLGSRTRLLLKNMQRHLTLPDSLFTFTAPAGVDVIGQAP
jgi:outer membrane lipoprotein carrier protein